MNSGFRRNAWIAFLLSFFPGGGQFYNGHMWKGVLILCTFWLLGISWLIGIIEAPLAVYRINQGKEKYKLRPIWLRLLVYRFFVLLYAAIIKPSLVRSENDVNKYYAARTVTAEP